MHFLANVFMLLWSPRNGEYVDALSGKYANMSGNLNEYMALGRVQVLFASVSVAFLLFVLTQAPWWALSHVPCVLVQRFSTLSEFE